MGFASTYLQERALFPELIHEAPDEKTGIIVVVPAYSEPDICVLLDSLSLCYKPDCEVEVIVIVNAPADASDESIENNRLTMMAVDAWKLENSSCFFRLYALMIPKPTDKKWGVGLARKTGMDEAVRRFNVLDKHEGVILNLDADCQVAKNYFESVCNELLKRKDRTACSIYFEHPLSGNEFHESTYKYIALYELHLRYYFQGLLFSGFPSVFHTVGSAIAVKALPYVKAGGMNRRQAGEDFYFIQKLIPQGGYFSLNSSIVYPSSRTSFRVPFGTGASISKLSEDKLLTLYSYNIMAFSELKSFFQLSEKYCYATHNELIECHKAFPSGLKLFIGEEEWVEKIVEIKDNTSGLPSFRKRFFGWFNMFKIVKYLNYVHVDVFEKVPVELSASQLLNISGISFRSKEVYELLLIYRDLEKGY